MGIVIDKMKIFLTAALVIFACSGCATIRHPVPPALVDKAQISGMPEVRVLMGEERTLMQQNLLDSVNQEDPAVFPVDSNGVKTYNILAISGGGANGAYGAGLLKGWSKEGSRPVFKIVTGVSTGALIAPFAFMGKLYDPQLEKYYTTMATKDVMSNKLPFMVLFGDSLSSNAPLAKAIEGIATKEILEKIAAEHRRGRRLFVGTANLDSEKFTIWDMGAIACRGDVTLFRKVMLASAAIPIIFPPSIFKVEADGKQYDELHVDGGTMTQVFATYKLLAGMEDAIKKLGIDPSKIKGKLYVIRNGYLSTTYRKVKDTLASLAECSFNTMVDAQSLGDTYRIYAFSKKRGTDYNLAFIPADFKLNNKEMFDPVDMKRLFDRGYQDAVGGYKWHKAPPGMDDESNIK